MLSNRRSEYMDKTLEEYIRDSGLSKQLVFKEVKEEPSREDDPVEDVVMDENNDEKYPTCEVEEVPVEPNRWNEISEKDLQWRMDRHRMPCLVRNDQHKKREGVDLRSKIYKRKNNNEFDRHFPRDLRNRIVGNRSQINPMARFLTEFGRQFKNNQKTNGNQLVSVNSSNQINGAMAVIGGILSSITPTPTKIPIDEKNVKIQNEIAQLQNRRKMIINEDGKITCGANDEPEIIDETTVRSVHFTGISMNQRFGNMTPMEVIL